MGNQWEVQRAGYLRTHAGRITFDDSRAEPVEEEVRQLRGIIDDYVNGVPMSKKKQLLRRRAVLVGVVNAGYFAAWEK